MAAWEREEESIDDITVIIVFFKRANESHEKLTDKTDQQTPETQRLTREGDAAALALQKQ